MSEEGVTGRGAHMEWGAFESGWVGAHMVCQPTPTFQSRAGLCRKCKYIAELKEPNKIITWSILAIYQRPLFYILNEHSVYLLYLIFCKVPIDRGYKGRIDEFFEGGSGQKFFKGVRALEKASPWEFLYRQAKNL